MIGSDWAGRDQMRWCSWGVPAVDLILASVQQCADFCCKSRAKRFTRVIVPCEHPWCLGVKGIYFSDMTFERNRAVCNTMGAKSHCLTRTFGNSLGITNILPNMRRACLSVIPRTHTPSQYTYIYLYIYILYIIL